MVIFHLPLGFVQLLGSFKLFQVVGEAFLAKRFSQNAFAFDLADCFDDVEVFVLNGELSLGFYFDVIEGFEVLVHHVYTLFVQN